MIVGCLDPCQDYLISMLRAAYCDCNTDPGKLWEDMEGTGALLWVGGRATAFEAANTCGLHDRLQR